MDKKQRAIYYAQKNIPVFPLYGVKDGCCECSKGAACGHPGKHPRTPHGMKDATTDVTQITKWWSQWGNSNIGLLTGTQSGFIVLDVDKRNGGMESLERLKKLNGGDFKTLVVQSGGGGLHYYFKHPGGGTFIKSKPLDGFKGVDIRGDNGSIIAAGSTHASGGVYEIVSGSFEALSPLPPCLLELLIKPHNGSDNASVSDAILEGERNHRLTSIAGSLRRAGLSEDAIKAALHIENKQKCQPPLPDAEVDAIAKSIGSKPVTVTTSVSVRDDDGGSTTPPEPIGEVIERLKAAGGFEIKWLWEGYIPLGRVITIAARHKRGKTTFVSHVAKAITRGEPFLGLETQKTSILWLGLDEHEQEIAIRFDALGVHKSILLYTDLRFKVTERNLQTLRQWIDTYHIGLVVVDTMLKFFGIKNENDAPEMDAAFAALIAITKEKPVSFLLIHHAKKPQGKGKDEETPEPRGSTVIGANSAVIITMDKVKAHGRKNQRKLQAESRYNITPDILYLEYTGNDYHVVDIPEGEGMEAENENPIKPFMTSTGGHTIKELVKCSGFSYSTVERHIKSMVERKEVEPDGDGKGGKPVVYWLKISGNGNVTSTEPPSPPAHPIGNDDGGRGRDAESVWLVQETFPAAKVVKINRE